MFSSILFRFASAYFKLFCKA